MKPMKITAAQQWALDEWQRRMGSVADQPHFLHAVIPERSNTASALRRSIRVLTVLGVFRVLPDHRIQLVPEAERTGEPTGLDLAHLII